MTRQLAKPQPLLARFGDAFVILSVTLLSLASGAWLISSFGLELTSAMLASLAIYGILLLLHLLVRRSFADTEDDDDELLYGDSHWQTAPAAERFETALARSALNAPPRAMAPGAEPPPHRSQPGIWPEPLPMPAGMDSGAERGRACSPIPSRSDPRAVPISPMTPISIRTHSARVPAERASPTSQLCRPNCLS